MINWPEPKRLSWWWRLRLRLMARFAPKTLETWARGLAAVPWELPACEADRFDQNAACVLTRLMEVEARGATKIVITADAAATIARYKRQHLDGLDALARDHGVH
jgi:hypothetical protein